MRENPRFDTPERRERGRKIREEAIAFLSGHSIYDAVKRLACGEAAVQVSCPLTAEDQSAILIDLQNDPGWNREFWTLRDSGDVGNVANSEFNVAAAERKFSRNECLRKPAAGAFCLRGLLSSLVSDEVRLALSGAFGQNIRFKSVDIARYAKDDYLRRHSDTFDDRRFGFVWFFSAGWSPGDGGELVIENEEGAALVVAPQQGNLAILTFRPGSFHQVAVIRSEHWTRYSIATHFAESCNASPAFSG